MTQRIEPLNTDDIAYVDNLRDWVVGHFDDPAAYATVEGKLRLIQTILDNDWVAPDETVKLQALGIAFGDAMEQEVPELSWVAVDDEFGRDPALCWSNTKTLVFPLTAISKRIENNEKVDVHILFSGYQNAIREAIASDA